MRHADEAKQGRLKAGSGRPATAISTAFAAQLTDDGPAYIAGRLASAPSTRAKTGLNIGGRSSRYSIPLEVIVRFKVLGPVEILDGSRAVAVQGAQQQTLLALLVINSGRVITKDQFYEELWGGDTPTNASNALQASIMRLRRLFKAELGEEFARDRLRTRHMGYSLDIEKDTVDAHLFENLIGKASEQMRTDHPRALCLLDQALALWKGPALQGVIGGPISRSAKLRLEEGRLGALEDRLQLLIPGAGESGSSVIGELKTMTHMYPWRERIVELLMSSLYRAGRQVEAVEVYNHVRTRLVEELGMEPSPLLQKRLRSILNHDSAMRAQTSPRGRTSG
jgi:DNA-binding SARP family transcriptional activator